MNDTWPVCEPNIFESEIISASLHIIRVERTPRRPQTLSPRLGSDPVPASLLTSWRSRASSLRRAVRSESRAGRVCSAPRIIYIAVYDRQYEYLERQDNRIDHSLDTTWVSVPNHSRQKDPGRHIRKRARPVFRPVRRDQADQHHESQALRLHRVFSTPPLTRPSPTRRAAWSTTPSTR